MVFMAHGQTNPTAQSEGKKKRPLKSGVIELTRAITTDTQKAVSSEPVEDTAASSQTPPASVAHYTKEARGKQATDRQKVTVHDSERNLKFRDEAH